MWLIIALTKNRRRIPPKNLKMKEAEVPNRAITESTTLL